MFNWANQVKIKVSDFLRLWSSSSFPSSFWPPSSRLSSSHVEPRESLMELSGEMKACWILLCLVLFKASHTPLPSLHPLLPPYLHLDNVYIRFVRLTGICGQSLRLWKFHRSGPHTSNSDALCLFRDRYKGDTAGNSMFSFPSRAGVHNSGMKTPSQAISTTVS